MSESRLTLPSRPNLEWLRKAAKDELERLRVESPQGKLADAQRSLARAYGFPSWRKLKSHVENLAAAPSESPTPTASQAPAFPEESAAIFFQLIGAGELDRVKLILDRL